MLRIRLIVVALTAVLGCASLSGQTVSSQDAPDVKVELRTVSGSTRFQLGEVIPVELLISSSTPNRYLEPCTLFAESCFGNPLCRFHTRWSFDVSPATGWTDIGFHGCRMSGGPTFEVKSVDLAAEPKKYAYTLSNRFRFDTPGRYTVRLSLTVGLDDDTNQIGKWQDQKAQHHSVSKTAELVLEIVPAEEAWKSDTLARGVAAWTAPPPPYTNPPSPAFLKQQQEEEAACNLGTPEAAVAFVGLLARGVDTRHCLRINSNKDAAMAEFGRLLVAPEVGVRPEFFAEYASLLSEREAKDHEHAAITPPVATELRDRLFASLPKKTPEAMAVSLDTVLVNPANGYRRLSGYPYDLQEPYSHDIIAAAAASFDRLTPRTRDALLDRDWEHVRSPLMLPVVRREAEKGNGHALLRWQELDPAAAAAFMRREVVQSPPRFSSTYLRLPERSLSAAEQQQLAANFITYNRPEDLITEGTLLHRYGSSATLPAVLPFIDQHIAAWPCEVQVPVLAYLLKTSPEGARTRLLSLLKAVRPGYCPQGKFFWSIGFLQAGSVLDRLAAEQLEAGTPLAEDAATYLGSYAGAAMKPVVWQQLASWHKKLMESTEASRMLNANSRREDYELTNLNSRLLHAFVEAHGWVLSPDDARRLSDLIGVKATEGFACTFACGSQVSVGPGPGTYLVYGRLTEPVYPPYDRFDYLLSTEPYQYQINQYGCRSLESLEEKLLQFPAGSKFSFAHTGSADDVGDWPAISKFLRSHGYVAVDPPPVKPLDPWSTAR